MLDLVSLYIDDVVLTVMLRLKSMSIFQLFSVVLRHHGNSMGEITTSIPNTLNACSHWNDFHATIERFLAPSS
jgi:hypothetical protein